MPSAHGSLIRGTIRGNTAVATPTIFVRGIDQSQGDLTVVGIKRGLAGRFWSVPSAARERTLAIGRRPRRSSSGRAGGVVAMNRVQRGGVGLVMALGCWMAAPASGQESGAPPEPGVVPPAPAREAGARQGGSGTAAPAQEPAVKPLMEGPLHEAFLSPRKDLEPIRADKAPRPRSPSGRPSTRPAPRPSGSTATGSGTLGRRTSSG